MLLERRTRAELEELLEERLAATCAPVAASRRSAPRRLPLDAAASSSRRVVGATRAARAMPAATSAASDPTTISNGTAPPSTTDGVEPVAQLDVGDHRARLVGRQRVDGATRRVDHLARADRRDVHDRSPGLDRPEARDRELLLVLVGAAEVGVVRLEHVELARRRAHPPR